MTQKIRLGWFASVALGLSMLAMGVANAATNNKELTNSADCDSGDGAYGTAWAWYDTGAGVGTIGGTASGCNYRIIDSSSFYWSGSWHNGGDSGGYQNYNVFVYSPEVASEAVGNHRICGAGPVCGLSRQTHAYVSW